MLLCFFAHEKRRNGGSPGWGTDREERKEDGFYKLYKRILGGGSDLRARPDFIGKNKIVAGTNYGDSGLSRCSTQLLRNL